MAGLGHGPALTGVCTACRSHVGLDSCWPPKLTGWTGSAMVSLLRCLWEGEGPMLPSYWASGNNYPGRSCLPARKRQDGHAWAPPCCHYLLSTARPALVLWSSQELCKVTTPPGFNMEPRVHTRSESSVHAQASPTSEPTRATGTLRPARVQKRLVASSLDPIQTSSREAPLGGPLGALASSPSCGQFLENLLYIMPARGGPQCPQPH